MWLVSPGLVKNVAADDILLLADGALRLRVERVSGDDVIGGLDGGLTNDLVALDLRQALHHLGEITGETVSETLLETIFGRFCIGK